MAIRCALDNINVINKNIAMVKLNVHSLTNTEHNVLMVALDHMEEHLNDIRSDMDCYEDELTNMQRLVDIKSLQELFKL